MNISQIIQLANNLADEQEDASIVIEFVNDAIAKINVECDANFPFFSLTDSSAEPKFPEKWQRALLIPFTVGRIKQLDSSQFEYTDSYNQFLDNLTEFKSRYTIPDEYKDANSNKTFASDIYTTPPYPDWRF